MKTSMDVYKGLIKQIEETGKKLEMLERDLYKYLEDEGIDVSSWKIDLPLETLMHDHIGALLIKFLENYEK